MNQAENAVADNLKRVRESRSLSLDQVAELTGVSKSMLRQIETGRSSPTIATIWKIANGLRLSFTSLVSRRSPPVAILDFKGAKPLTAEHRRYRLYPVIPFDPDRSFEVYYVEIEPATTFGGEPHQGNVEEYVFVTQGRLRIVVDDATHDVDTHHCVRFKADRPHTYRNVSRQTVTAIMMICYLA